MAGFPQPKYERRFNFSLGKDDLQKLNNGEKVEHEFGGDGLMTIYPVREQESYNGEPRISNREYLLARREEAVGLINRIDEELANPTAPDIEPYDKG